MKERDAEIKKIFDSMIDAKIRGVGFEPDKLFDTFGLVLEKGGNHHKFILCFKLPILWDYVEIKSVELVKAK